MKVCNSSKMRMLRIFVYFKKVGVFVLGAFFILCFITGCYNICHRPFSGFVHSVILDDRYDKYNYHENISEQITFYGNGAHGYIRNNVTGKKVLRDVRWVRTSSKETDTLACYASNGFRGYLDVRTGKPVIPAERYIKAWLFSEGLAAIMEKDSTIKFIDTRGQVVIDKGFRYPTFAYGYLFYDSLCAMTDRSGKWGVINRAGEWVVRPEYDGIAHNDAGFWQLSKDGKKGLLDKKAISILPMEYRNIEVLEQGISVVLDDYTMRMMNYDGSLKYKFVCDELDDLYYSTPETDETGCDIRKLAPCKAYNTYEGHCGLLGPDGIPLTLPLFTGISAVNANLYYCRFDHSDSGVIMDSKGRIVNESY
ncbi:MAG: WG repeat-containing protein [Prevotella sp.]|nr:WG repeat-containing protein [Prevotella sp.]